VELRCWVNNGFVGMIIAENKFDVIISNVLLSKHVELKVIETLIHL
jgi:hypothetical protein